MEKTVQKQELQKGSHKICIKLFLSVQRTHLNIIDAARVGFNGKLELSFCYALDSMQYFVILRNEAVKSNPSVPTMRSTFLDRYSYVFGLNTRMTRVCGVFGNHFQEF